MSTPVMAATAWPTNADMIADCANLGYLRSSDRICDPTWGLGRWWTKWQPAEGNLHGSDIDPAKSPTGTSIDFRRLHYADATYDAVTFDPPYKLNGTPTATTDARYGVHVIATRAGRMQLILDGITECARVVRAGGYVLAKAQDQVNGGKVRWQTIEIANHARGIELELVDMLHMLGHRPQPAGRSQQHARRNLSTLLILQKTGAA